MNLPTFRKILVGIDRRPRTYLEQSYADHGLL